MRWLGYSLREAGRSLRRGGRLSVISLGAIMTAFLTLGVFLVIEAHIRQAAAGWADAAELSVFLADGLDEGRLLALQQEIAADAAVAGVHYISKPDALSRFTKDFPELSDVSSSLAENPFPASFEVSLRPERGLADAGDALAETLRARPGVADVQYDRQWLADLSALGTGVHIAGLGAVVILIISAALTVAAVIRLGLHARKDELEIMELVGAPFVFIRGPFIAEGAILGGIGAMAAMILLWLGVDAAHRAGIAAITALYGTGPLAFLDPFRAALLVGGAMAVGGLAGVIASHPSPRKRGFSGLSR